MAQREGSIYLYLFIASFILFAGMVVIFFVIKADKDTWEAAHQTLVKGVEPSKIEPLANFISRERAKLDELNQLKEMIGGPEAVNNFPRIETFKEKLKEVSDKFNELAEKLQLPKREPVSLMEPYDDMLNVLNALKRAWDEANEGAKGARDQAKIIQETTDKQLQELDKKLTETKQSLADAERRAEESDQANRKKIEELTQQLDKSGEEASEKEIGFKREQARLNNIISQREAKIEKLEKEIVATKNIEDIEPDGQIIQVEPLTRLAWINRGRKDHMRPGTEFRIFQFVGGKKVFKGKGEINRVEEDLSLMRITEETDELNPISTNDQVTSPFYDPKSTPIFVFAGDKLADIDYTMDYVVRRIQSSGGEVRKEVGHDTDFVVAIKGYETSPQYKAAREFKVTIIRESDLLEYLGY